MPNTHPALPFVHLAAMGMLVALNACVSSDATTGSSGAGAGGAADDVPGTEVLAAGRNRPIFIAVDASGVYVSEADGLIRLRPGISEPEVLSTELHSNLLALDDAYVYTIDAKSGAVNAMPKAGGAVTPLATSTQPREIAVDASHVYWIDADPDGKCPHLNGCNAIRRVPKMGGAVETLALGQPWAVDLTLDTDFAYWVSAEDGVVSTPGGESSLWRRSLAAPPGQPPELLAEHLLSPASVAVDANNIYVIVGTATFEPPNVETPGDIITIAKSTGVQTIVHGTLGPDGKVPVPFLSKHARTLDGRVYWLEGSKGVERVDAMGSIELRARDRQITDFAFHDGSLYWVDFTSGRVARAPL